MPSDLAENSTGIEEPVAEVLPDSFHIPDFAQLSEIEATYNRDIKKIFVRNCYACHTADARAPGAAVQKVIGLVVGEDTLAARNAIDMSKPFPFASRYATLPLLMRLRQSIETGEMPPLEFLLFNLGAGLSPDERRIVSAWLSAGIDAFLGAPTAETTIPVPAAN
jgi:mono/diheme cytochrome c family protein